MIKRAAAAALVLGMVFTLWGCGGRDEAPDDQPSPPPSDTQQETQLPEKETDDTIDETDDKIDGEAEDDNGEDEEITDDTTHPDDTEDPSHTQPDKTDDPPAQSQPVDPYAPDENGMMNINGIWVEKPKELNSSSLETFGKKLNGYKSSYLAGASSVKYSIIPDKSWYAREYTDNYLDHEAMASGAAAGLGGWEYIDISSLLTLNDFYSTDPHWKQESIIPVANRIASGYGFSVSKGSFTTQSRSGFCGDYRRKIGDGYSETICWLEDGSTSAATADNFQRPASTTVYDPSLLSTNSPFDIFLGGPTPVVKVTNPNGPEGKRMVMFRDSFGSSLAPLLLSGYSEITLVDTRYMAPTLLPQYADFDGADVLFIFSAAVVNNSNLLR